MLLAEQLRRNILKQLKNFTSVNKYKNIPTKKQKSKRKQKRIKTRLTFSQQFDSQQNRQRVLLSILILSI